ncbi:MAG: ubiquinol-cytochrome c reductase iron-sulfur subunit [Candidatus Zixiibacteriota bacterium]|nr:MAG: ubiquinol-cytochrome c reductase iron-sulfur subunit [candidate division Zixibacteria bacterium]
MAPIKSSRRGFLEVILGGGVLATLGAVVYPVIRYIIPPAAGEAKLSQLKLPFTRADIEADPKKAKYFKYGRNLGIIYLTEKNELRALAATCTHLDCTVQHRPDLGIIWCSCHNGRYDLDGNNISGPPPRPLERYAVKETDDVILVSRENA